MTTPRCKHGCQYKSYQSGYWYCGAIDWAEDDEYNKDGSKKYLVTKYAVLDMNNPTPEWCPLERDEKT